MPRRAPIAKPARFQSEVTERERRRRAAGLRRLYDSAQWRERTRPFVLMRDPLCKIAKLCDGLEPSTEADHIIPAAKYVAQHGGDLHRFFDLCNLQGACKPCHTAKTASGG